MTSAALRDRLGLSRAAWARVLGVHERTVARWETDGVDPGGTTSAVIRGIEMALEEATDPAWIRRRLEAGGVSGLVYDYVRRRRKGIA